MVDHQEQIAIDTLHDVQSNVPPSSPSLVCLPLIALLTFTIQGGDDALGDPDVGFSYDQLEDALRDDGGIVSEDEEEDGDGEEEAGEGEEEEEDGEEEEEQEGDEEEASEDDDDGNALLDEVDALEDSSGGEDDEEGEEGFVLAPGAAEYLAKARARAAAEATSGTSTARKAKANKRLREEDEEAELTIGRPSQADEPGVWVDQTAMAGWLIGESGM